MVIRFDFRDINNGKGLKNEIKLLFPNEGNLNDDELSNKNWICATLDDKQILGGDAENLANGFKKIGINGVLTAWVADLLNKDYFVVDKFGSDSTAIEEMQNPWGRVDHMSSFIFSEYPLRFLIYRPDTCQDRLMVLGPVAFVMEVIKLEGWELYKTDN